MSLPTALKQERADQHTLKLLCPPRFVDQMTERPCRYHVSLTKASLPEVFQVEGKGRLLFSVQPGYWLEQQPGHTSTRSPRRDTRGCRANMVAN
jgi:hypothetical protein